MEKLQPKLRFPEFREAWRYNKIKEVTSYVDYRGRAPVKTENGHFLVTAKNIKKGFIDYDCSKEYVSEDDYLNVMSKGLPALGDILFTTEAPMGNVAQVDDESIALAQRVIKFRGNNSLSNRYLLHLMLSDVFQNKISEKAIGSTVQGISGKELHNIIISFPSIEEQTKIATFLSSVDEKLNLLKEKKALLEEYKKGMMQKIFSQELRFKDENGKDFADWEEKSLGEISSKPKYGLNSSAVEYDGINGYIRITDIDDKSRKFLQNKITSPDKYDDSYLLEENDLLFTRTGASTGKSYLYDLKDGKLYFAGFLIKFNIHRNKAISKFIFYQTLLSEYDKWVQIMSMRSGQPGINAEEYSSLKILLPSVDEQIKIANFLSAIDEKIELVSQQIEDTQEYKKGLLQQMFC